MTQDTKSPQSVGFEAEKKADTQDTATHSNAQSTPQSSTAPASLDKVDFAGGHGTAPIHIATPTSESSSSDTTMAEGFATYPISSSSRRPSAGTRNTEITAPLSMQQDAAPLNSEQFVPHPSQETEGAGKGEGTEGIEGTGGAGGAEGTEESPTNASTDASEQATEETLPLGIAAKTFQHMAAWGPLYMCLFFVLHMFAALLFPSIFYYMELQYIDVFTSMQQAGQWFIPPVTDALGATFPGYYWFMGLVHLIPVPKTLFLPLLSSLTAFIAVSGVYTLGRCCRLENNGAFGALLLLLSCPLFLAFLHLIGPELLTTGFFCFALALIFRGLTRESAPFSFIFGFIFTALATFTGGFLPLWTILIASILLVLWRLDIHRAQKLDAVVGFGCMVLLFAAWLVIVILGSQEAAALDTLMKQAIVPFMPPYWPVPMPWTLVFLAVGLIPWIIAPLFSPWFGVLATSFKSLQASRKDNSGPTWLYLVTLVGMALVVMQKQEMLSAALPLLPVLGIILGATICNFSKTGSNIFFLLMALILLVCGAVLTVISIPAAASYWTSYVSKYASEEITTMLQNMPGLPLFSGLCILTAALLIKFTQRQSPHGSLLVIALFSMLAVQPFFAFVSPSLVGPYAKYHSWDSGLGAVFLPQSMPQPKLEDTAVQPLWKGATSTTKAPAETPTPPKTPLETAPTGVAPTTTPPSAPVVAPPATDTPEIPITAPAPVSPAPAASTAPEATTPLVPTIPTTPDSPVVSQ